jgi:Tfp pilus assembly protein PilN
MIQLNLLPDIKLEYIKAQRQRRLLITASALVAAAAIAILLILLAVDLAQKKHLSDLNNDITTESQTLRSKPNIGTILTVQNQLESLTALHATEPAASRLFTNYLDEVTPATVAITSLHFDFTQQSATITGTADSLKTVNQYIDTLKLTTYTTSTDNTPAPAFSNIVLSSFSLNSSSTDPSQAASYTITLSYDKNIFDITQNIGNSGNLTVPNVVTTRSEVSQPGDLFKATPITTTGGGQ